MLNSIFSTVPSESGISLFGAVHITILLISIILCFAVIKINKESKLFERLTTLIITIIHICLYTWYCFSVENFITKGLPLHSCRMALILLIIGIFFKKDFLLKIGSYWGLFGGFGGLLLPTIEKYAFPHILQISSFSLHVYLLVISVYNLFVKKIGMTKRELIVGNTFTVLFLAFTFIVNMIVGSHYSYTSRMPSALLKMGISFPPVVCFLIVTTFYVVLECAEYMLLNSSKKAKTDKSEV